MADTYGRAYQLEQERKRAGRPKQQWMWDTPPSPPVQDNRKAKDKGIGHWVKLAVLLLVAMLGHHAQAQATKFDPKVVKLAQAIARAEGFGVRGARPTRNNNPGDIRTAKTGLQYRGQVGVARGGYVRFRTAAYGWAALYAQVQRIIDGNSRWYTLDTTINQMAARYAADWKPWAKNVAKLVGIPGTMTLRDYFELPPQVDYVAKLPTNLFTAPALPVLAAQERSFCADSAYCI